MFFPSTQASAARRGHARRSGARRAAVRAELTKAVVLDAENIAFMDVTAVEMLDELGDTLKEEGAAQQASATPDAPLPAWITR